MLVENIGDERYADSPPSNPEDTLVSVHRNALTDYTDGRLANDCSSALGQSAADFTSSYACSNVDFGHASYGRI